MSILNIALQAVGLMRSEILNLDIEEGLKKCSGMKDIRTYVDKDPGVQKEILEAVQSIKDLSASVFSKSLPDL